MKKLSKVYSDFKKSRLHKRLVDGFRAGINGSYEKLPNKTELTPDQKRAVKDYYREMIGMDVPTDWHRYFSARTGEFSVKYVPNAIYALDIRPRLNYYPFLIALSDKNLQDIILPSEHQPETFLKNINGYFYAGNEPVTKSDALDRCENAGEFIIKPSLLSKGRGISMHSVRNGMLDGTGKTLESLFEEYGKNYLLQRPVKQHPDMSALNPTSVNTIRILTYRSEDEVLVVYTIIRIGRSGQLIDNESAGGMSVKINPDGTLAKYGFAAPGQDRIERTDSGIELEGYQVPSFNESLELVKSLHLRLPYFNLIGWDICIGESGRPILIEWNSNPGLSQSAFGPGFGEYTEKILKEAMARESSCPIEAYSHYINIK